MRCFPTVLISLVISLLVVGVELSCQYSNNEVPKMKYVCTAGTDTFILFLDSTYHAIDCDIYQYDDAFCYAYESKKCRVYCNFSSLSDPDLKNITTIPTSDLNSSEQTSMVNKIRDAMPESVVGPPKSISSKKKYEGNFVPYQYQNAGYLAFRGVGLKQRLGVSVNLESNSIETDLEKELICILDNLLTLDEFALKYPKLQ